MLKTFKQTLPKMVIFPMITKVHIWLQTSLTQLINSSNHDLPRLVGWEINVPFRHNIRPNRGSGLGWRCSFARL